jgi:hypothetical protein
MGFCVVRESFDVDYLQRLSMDMFEVQDGN